jgi:hypothetical protein
MDLTNLAAKISQLIKSKKRTLSIYFVFICWLLIFGLALGMYLDIRWCLFLVRHYAFAILWIGSIMGVFGRLVFYDEQTSEEKLREEKILKLLRQEHDN